MKVEIKPPWDRDMWLLKNCNLDRRTVANIVHGVVPSLRRGGMFTELEIDAAFAHFVRRAAQGPIAD